MTIAFMPKAGMVLLCDFGGYIKPEMVKRRPVVTISPNHLKRPGLVTVVPLSTTEPRPLMPYHVEILGSPVPGWPEVRSWAKCDMVAVVSLDRLDRVKVGRQYSTGQVSADTVWAIRRGVALSIGIDILTDKPDN